jgi:pilus assembly protein CpaC
LLGGQAVTQNNGAVATGDVIRLPGAEDLQGKTLVNLLNVPGEHQVMLKVRIAEVTRTAARDMGVDFDFLQGTDPTPEPVIF